MSELASANHLDDVRALIGRHGWAVQAVEGEGITPHAYTVGLTGRGAPELLVIGLPGRVAAAVLNRVAPAWLAGEIPLGGRLDLVIGDSIRSADVLLHAGGLAVVAAAVYGPDRVAVAELVWTREA